MIEKIAYSLPKGILTNEEIAERSQKWTAEEIFQKMGIRSRRILEQEQMPSDLALQACEEVLKEEDKSTIDFLICCTETPDYSLPATACVLQNKLGLKTTLGAFDINLGCSGYIYGLGVANAMIAQGLANKVLFVTADGYSKMMHQEDWTTRAIFGDAATATILSRSSSVRVSHFTFGTDGSGYEQLICGLGGFKQRGDSYELQCLRMNGPEIFNFTLKKVPELVGSILEKSSLNMDTIDKFVFHQANGFMLEHLRRKIKIPQEKFVLHFETIGNTVSSTIPICMSNLMQNRESLVGQKWLLIGFGVGLSWAGCVVEF